jgi:hypothetical protein
MTMASSAINGMPVTGIAGFGNTGLTSVTIPDNVRVIGFGAFDGCASLTSVFMGSGVTNISLTVDPLRWAAEPNAFPGCSSLTNFSVAPLNPAYSSLDGVLLNKTQDRLLDYPPGGSGGYAVPHQVTSFGKWAFVRCAGLTTVTIPSSVTNIGHGAFEECSGLTGVTIPKSVISIGGQAFDYCTELVSVLFLGSAPAGDGASGLAQNSDATIYYLPGSTGWGATFGGVPAVLWNPQIQLGDGGFGVRIEGFSFNITGTPNIPFVVEASTNLTTGFWVPPQTLTLTTGLVSFRDPSWTNYPTRFYRLRWP